MSIPAKSARIAFLSPRGKIAWYFLWMVTAKGTFSKKMRGIKQFFCFFLRSSKKSSNFANSIRLNVNTCLPCLGGFLIVVP